jgi:hypothetical protein
MKTSKLFALLLAGVLPQLIAAQAADLFAVTVRGTCKEISGDDKIVSVRFDNNSIIRDYAATQDPAPDPRTLKVVYDATGDRIGIMNEAGEITCEVWAFGFSTSVADSADTKRIRHVFLFPEGASDATGSAILTEKVIHDGETNVVKLTSRGSLQFAKAATDETAAQVCTGTFTVGKKIIIATEPEPPTEPEEP